MSIEFKDNTAEVTAAIGSAVSTFLHEAGSLLRSQTSDNSRVDTGQTRGSYEYKVTSDGNTGTVYVGSNYENAIWEEYGTGEYAVNGDGRKDAWVYKSSKDGKFYRTTGKKPNKPLTRAFNSSESKIKARLETILKENL